MKTQERRTKIVVIGGTGLIGSKVVTKLQSDGLVAVAASPASGVNTLTGEGLAEVLQGAAAVVDVTNSPSFEEKAVMEFFTTSTRTLLKYEEEAGVQHHVLLSVVGARQLAEAGSPYMRAKIAQEQLVMDSPIPYSIVRATQFFEFIDGIADAATAGDTVRLPRVLFRPIAADEVAHFVSKVAAGNPLNGTAEIAGPEEYHFDDVVRKVLASRNDPRTVVADATARYFGAELSDTTLVPSGDAQVTDMSLDGWLSSSTKRAASGAKTT